MTDEDRYVVYTGIEGSGATFSLYDDGGVMTQLTMTPEEVPSGTEIGDHFWVDHDEESDIVRLRFDSDFTAQKREEARTAVRKYQELQKNDREELSEDTDG
jgi:hypothetical protein